MTKEIKPCPLCEAKTKFNQALEELKWLRQTANGSQDNARIVGFEDCLRQWKKAIALAESKGGVE